MKDRRYIYYDFLVTLSRLFEKEEEGYTYYDGNHETIESAFQAIYNNYLEKVGKPYHGTSKTSNSSSQRP